MLRTNDGRWSSAICFTNYDMKVAIKSRRILYNTHNSYNALLPSSINETCYSPRDLAMLCYAMLVQPTQYENQFFFSFSKTSLPQTGHLVPTGNHGLRHLV